MDLRNERELQNTRQKLELLERLYQDAAAEAGGDQELREVEMESLMRSIKHLKEEIARYEARSIVRG